MKELQDPMMLLYAIAWTILGSVSLVIFAQIVIFIRERFQKGRDEKEKLKAEIAALKEKNEERVEKKGESIDMLRFESFQRDLNHNHRETMLLVESLKDGQKRLDDGIKERKEVSNEKMTLIHLLSERVTKLEGRVDQLEDMKEDISEIKKMIRENAQETKRLFEKNEDDIGKITIAMFNAGIK
jgi:methyl-accepting chemotaxis protein